jgi:hypothetical protein
LTAAISAVSISASSSRGVRLRATAVRTGPAPWRSLRPVVVMESPVALRTLATPAPVSSSRPATNRKTATMCDPTSPSSWDVSS